MVDFVDDPLKLERDMNRFAFSGDCPEELSNKLTSIPGSQADKINQGAKILYAHYDQLNDDGKRALGQILTYGINKNWTQYVAETNAETVVEFISRDLGERGALKAPSDMSEWPEPATEFRDGTDWRGPLDAEEPAGEETDPPAEDVPAEA